MNNFFVDYNTQILIVFRVFVVLEFIWKHYILALEFKSEEAIDPKDKRYFRTIIIYAFVSCFLSFFLTSKYVLLFIFFRLMLSLPRLVEIIVESIKEIKANKGKIDILYIGIGILYLFVSLGPLVCFVFVN